MALSQFESRFQQYLSDAEDARLRDLHHDQRRELFLSFLHDAFDIDLSEVEREQYIQLHGRQVQANGTARIRKGWIDAIFRDLVFEFKRNLEREEAEGLRELRDYLENTPNGAESIGLLTDGISFTAYVLDPAQPTGLRFVDNLELDKVSPPVAFSWLDAYLLSQKNIVPTSVDIVRRFGLKSPTFVAAARVLREELAAFDAAEAGASEVKREQWAFHLARVYGSADARNSEMFVRHTYLCQFAKILAAAAFDGAAKAASDIQRVISGAAFEVRGISNIGEQDFFAWVLAPEVSERTLNVFRHIAGSLAVYDLMRINEDLLKQLYQNLVEPETRHELGEFYTPDWLAELTLREISYGPGQSLLDPACGSGTFLFTALRLLAEQGIVGEELVDFALENVVGIDVHPLAVTIARINYMLAILPHLRAVQRRGQRPIPVAMANSLQVPDKAGPVQMVTVRFDPQRDFRIPTDAARQPGELAQVLDEMQRRAERMAETRDTNSTGGFGVYVLERLHLDGSWSDIGYVQGTWDTNLRHLAQQIAAGRDTIWVYVLKNSSQPLILQQRKFDVIAGNPPWIAYRYLQDPSYRADVKALTREYDLLGQGEAKLNTQIELSTLFFEHCYRMYLHPGGTLAFVMPRSVLTGAKQHRAFQQHGLSRVLDLEDVTPLFNVPTCVLVRTGDEPVKTRDIPVATFAGRVPAQECVWSQASSALTRADGALGFTDRAEITSPYYYPRVKQGATLVPRNLVFVTSAQPGLAEGQVANNRIMRSDPDADAEAKQPWKGVRWQGYVDDAFLYATLLSKHLMPFGVRRLHLVALPVQAGYPRYVAETQGRERELRFIPISLAEMRDSFNYGRSADEWFAGVEGLWADHKSTNTKEPLADWLNYQGKIEAQSAEPGYRVLYNASGSNLAAALLHTGSLPIINGARPKNFVVDHTMYWYRCATPEEGYYLVALLNAPCVNAAIKPGQTRGTFGARHVHRRPFEVCPISEFDPANDDHRELAALSLAAHEAISRVDLSSGTVGIARRKAREATAVYLDRIDDIAQRLLDLAPAPTHSESETGDEDSDLEA